MKDIIRIFNLLKKLKIRVMSKVLDYQYAANVVKFNGSNKAIKEKNDCFVRALSAATGSTYDDAHQFTADYFMREEGRGTMVELFLPNVLKETMKLGLNIEVDFKKVPNSQCVNRYKLNGEIIKRKKTVKSFIKDNAKGTYIVLVAGHAFTIIDGVLIDNMGEEFRPTRKVTGAIEVKSKEINTYQQLSLF